MERSLAALLVAGAITIGAGLAAAATEKSHRPARTPRVAVANAWLTPGGGRCLRTSRPRPFAPARACASFQAAYDVAVGGDSVLVRCLGTVRRCTFPAEHMTGHRGTPRRRISFRAAPGYHVAWEPMAGSGEPVWLDGLHNANFTHIGAGTQNVGARGNGFDANLRIDCSTDLTFRGMVGRRFHMFEGNARIRFVGGSWGGYATPGEEDSSIGTTEAAGPDGTPCPGQSTELPSTDIVFDGVTWHDVFANTPATAWGGSHPDCFEINGYTLRLTIENSRFLGCGNTFWSLYGSQGANYDVRFTHNLLRGLNDHPASDEYYGVQLHSDPGSPDTPGHGVCGNVVMSDNTVEPNNPHAPYAYSGFVIQCDAAPGYRPVELTGNTFDMVEPPSNCQQSKASPTNARWHRNRWRRGHRC
jgi:hypothetical protein